MPAYEYECGKCGREFTVYRSVKDYETKGKPACPKCKSRKVTRKLSGFFAKTARKA